MTHVFRILVIGKTGCGKSSFCNSLLDTNVFDVAGGMASHTIRSKWDFGTRGDKYIEVIDTPGLCDTDEEESVIFRELGKSVGMASPGPHVLVLVLRCDRRFTQEEFQAYMKLKELFSPEMTKYLVVVFNGVDLLSGSTIAAKKQKLHEEVKKMPGNLGIVLRDANFRYVGMSNAVPKSQQEGFIRDFMDTIMKLVGSNPNRYFSSMLIGEINSYFEGLMENYMHRLKLARAAAERKARKAILDEEKEAQETVRRMALKAEELGKDHVKVICSVM